MVIGSMILLGGEPGIGKSTLVAQICEGYKKKVLYISCEETQKQIKLRTNRLGIAGKNIVVWNESTVEKIFEQCKKIRAKLLIIDSIQVVKTEHCNSAIGSTNQVRETCNQILAFTKPKDITTIIIAHITKDGSIAGPKTLEHMVDAVLYFEQADDNKKLRILSASKNRFGNTINRGIFEMGPTGLIPFKTENPYELKSVSK
jgi:DNA repair protein RadA/Sms